MASRFIELADTAAAVASRLEGYKDRVSRRIAPGDLMYRGDLDGYLGIAYSGVACVAQAMVLTGTTSFDRILDLPSGHGRVTRALHAAFPEAEITACDVMADGVKFCADEFGSTPVRSSDDLDAIPLSGHYGLIFVGSLLTHFDASRCLEFIGLFERYLSPMGILVMSSHGRNAVQRWRDSAPQLEPVIQGFDREGFGYMDYPGVSGYGISAFTAGWLTARLAGNEELTMVGYYERGYADHQDMFTLLKLPVHHAQNQLCLV